MRNLTSLFFILFSVQLLTGQGYAEPAAPAPGSLDTKYGEIVNGRRRGFTEDRFIVANAVALQSDGKAWVAGRTTVNTPPLFSIATYSENGDSSSVDLSFGIPNQASEANALVIHAKTNKITAAGYAGDNFAVAQLLANGSLDPTFGDNGQVTTSFGTGTTSVANAIAIDSKNRVVVAGFAKDENDDEYYLAIARYSSTGQLDPTFGVEGKVKRRLSASSTKEIINGIVLRDPTATDPTYLIAAGLIGRKETFAVMRFTETGDYNEGFVGLVGTFSTGPGSANAISLANRTPDGLYRVFVAGGASSSQLGLSTSVLTSLSNGIRPTTGFAAAGFSFGDVSIPPVIDSETANALAQYPSNAFPISNANKIVTVGEVVNLQGVPHFYLSRISESGIIDVTFGNPETPGQMISTEFEGTATGVAIDKNGKIIVVGQSTNEEGDPISIIARYNS